MIACEIRFDSGTLLVEIVHAHGVLPFIGTSRQGQLVILHPTELADFIPPVRIAYGRIDYVVRLIVIARIDGGATTGAGYGHVIG